MSAVPVPPCPAVAAPGQSQVCACKCYQFQGSWWARRTPEGNHPTEPGCPASHRADVCECVGCTWDAGTGAYWPQGVTPGAVKAPARTEPVQVVKLPSRDSKVAGSGLTVPDVAGLALVQAAVAYAEAGWFVAPIDLGDLRNPGAVLGNGWPEKTSKDPAQVRRWFSRSGEAYARAHGRLGIALHVGRSGAVALDVDHPEHVPEVVRRAVKETRPPWQSSRENVPGRGAYLWALPPGVSLGNSAGRLGKDWGEVKGTNGTIHVAPTAHHKAAEGGRYLWARTGPLPVLPPALLEALRAPERRPATTAAQPIGNVRNRVRGLLDKVLTSTPGERNGVLHWAACRFGELVAAGALSEAVAETLLTRAGEEVGLIPAEATATVTSGIRAGMGGAA